MIDMHKKLYDFEYKHNLMNKKIKDIYFWKIIRFDVFNEIMRLKNDFKYSHPSSHIKRKKTIVLFEILYNDYISFKSRIKLKRFKKYVFISSSRKHFINNSYTDKFIIPFYKEFIKFENNSSILEFSNDRNIKEYPLIVFHPYRLAIKLLTYFKKMSFDIKKDKLLKYISSLISKEFEINIDLVKLYIENITYFNTCYKFYTKVFKKNKPSYIFFENSYGNEGLILACKENNVITIEFQHGLISEFHSGYDFGSNIKVPYFPNKMIVFGDYWKDSNVLPISEKDIFVYGKQSMSRINEKKRSILVISQGPYIKNILNFIDKFLSFDENYKIILKLHPSECINWKSNDAYSKIMIFQNSNRFNLLTCDASLEKALNESEFILAVDSTVIFEAIQRNCKVIKLSVDGSYSFKYLTENKYIFNLNDKFDKFELLEALMYNFEKLENDYFFKNSDFNYNDFLKFLAL